MPRVIKWGILGLGKIAHKFTLDIKLVEDCQLIAVASSSKSRAKAFAKKYNISEFYSDYQELYINDDIDIIYIASSNENHYIHTLEALKNKKAVLCEKPLAVNKNQVLNLIRFSQIHKVFLMEALWTRFNPTFEQLLEWIEKDKIGKLRYINATFSFYGLNKEKDSRLFNPFKAGGSLLDIGIYPLFLAYKLLGTPNSLISKAIKTTTGVDEQMALILTYDSSHALLYSSFSHEEDMRATICGEKGEIYIDSRWHESPIITLIQKGKKTIQKFNFLGKGYSYEIIEANNCLRNRLNESPKWTLQNSFDLVELMDIARNQNGINFPIE